MTGAGVDIAGRGSLKLLGQMTLAQVIGTVTVQPTQKALLHDGFLLGIRFVLNGVTFTLEAVPFGPHTLQEKLRIAFLRIRASLFGVLLHSCAG